VGPTTRAAKDEFAIDYADDAVRGMLVVDKGQDVYPAPPYTPPEAPKKATADVAPPRVVPQWQRFGADALKLSVLAAVLTALGRAASPELAVLLTTFALSCLAGYQAVLGVPPALHSPLMSVTNAVSGLTAVGAMLLLPGKTFAITGTAQILGAAALVASAINSAPPPSGRAACVCARKLASCSERARARVFARASSRPALSQPASRPASQPHPSGSRVP
jgi:NAD(P) transhydrogenase